MPGWSVTIQLMSSTGTSTHVPARELFDQWAPRLLAFLKTRLRSRPDIDAEDALYQLWIKCAGKTIEYDEPQKMLFAAARNLAIDLMRKKSARQWPEEGVELVDPADQPAEELIKHEEEAKLADCLKKLDSANPEQARIIRAILRGDDYSAVCQDAGIAAPRAYKLKFNGTAFLRQCVEEGCEP